MTPSPADMTDWQTTAEKLAEALERVYGISHFEAELQRRRAEEER